MADSRSSEKPQKLDTEECSDSGYISCPLTGPISEEITSEKIESEKDNKKPEEKEKKPTTSENLQSKTIVEEETSTNLDSAYESGAMDSAYDSKAMASFSQMSLNEPKQQHSYFVPNEDGDTYLHMAIIMLNSVATKILIRLAPDPSYLDDRNKSFHAPLHLAVYTSQPNIVRDLITGGAKPTVREARGNTALHLACNLGLIECAKQLLTPLSADEMSQRRGTYTHRFPQDLEIWNNDGETCLHVAAKAGHTDLIKLLVEYGADINAQEGKAGRTILHKACDEGNEKLVVFLLNEFKTVLNLEVENYQQNTPYEMAAINAKYFPQRFARILEELKNHGACPYELREDDDDDATGLHKNAPQCYNSTPINVA